MIKLFETQTIFEVCGKQIHFSHSTEVITQQMTSGHPSSPRECWQQSPKVIPVQQNSGISNLNNFRHVYAIFKLFVNNRYFRQFRSSFMFCLFMFVFSLLQDVILSTCHSCYNSHVHFSRFQSFTFERFCFDNPATRFLKTTLNALMNR